MKILREYTIDFIKRNKRSTIAIIISIIISTILITTLSSIIYNMQMDDINLIKKEQGDWHGELFDEVKGKNLKYVLAHPNVETVMIKGGWQTGKLNDEGSKRPYIIFQNLTDKYFTDIISGAIIEGRMAENIYELVVSDIFIRENPQYKLGGKIELSVGKRNYNGQEIDTLSPYIDDETFVEESFVTYEIVGISDTKTNSVVPGYYAMGYMDTDNIKADDDLTIYMRFKNPRKTYTDLPQIAESVGFEKDEYGNYLLKYNSSLLAKYFIFPKTTFSFENIFQYTFIWSILLVAALVVALFVIIIHAAFSISTNSRIKQFGMLKSIGATPKQIKMSVLFEALLLSVISIPIGIILGHLLSISYIKIANTVNTSFMYEYDTVIFSFSWIVVVISSLLALITVWFSALIPVKKLNKLLPIEAMKYSGNIKLKKSKRSHLPSKLFGITGELAVNSFAANKKANITSLMSLIISFILLIVFLNIFVGMENAQKDIFGESNYWELRDITFTIMDGNPLSDSFKEEINNIDHINDTMFYSNTAGSVWVDENKESEESKQTLSFKDAAKTNKYPIYELDGKYRLRAELIGLDNENFIKYCDEIGTDYKEYYDLGNTKYIVVNSQEDIENSTKRFPINIPLLNIEIDDFLNFSGKIRDSDEEEFKDSLQIGYITDKYPKTGEYYGVFTIAIVMPMEIYQNFVSNFDNEKAMNSLFTNAIIKTDGNIESPLEEIENILSDNYSLGDFRLNDILTRTALQDRSQIMFNVIIYFLTFLLAIIGLSNTFATVTNSMQIRKQEFAMLRSVGISPKDFFKLFIYEALYFTLVPFILGLCISSLIITMLLKTSEIYLLEYMKYIPFVPIIAYVLIILFLVLAIYFYSYKKTVQENIVDNLRNELL